MSVEFEIAKQSKKALEVALDSACDALKAFDSYGKTDMGMTPDHVKAMPEWREVKREFDAAFSEPQKF